VLRFLAMRVWVCLVAALLSQPPSAARNSVTGRVTAPDGTGVTGAAVTLLERSEQNGLSRIHPASVRAVVMTDARGEYVLPNAPLGDYFVVAIPHNPARAADGSVLHSGVGITYYPSAASPEDATTVTVDVREPQRADITLKAARLSAVRGVVVDSQGRLVRGGLLHIAHGDHLFGVANGSIPIQSDGTFAVAGLAPGTYFLQYREGAWPPPRDTVPLISGATVVAAGADLAGVRVAPVHMVQASGRVIAPVELRAEIARSGGTVGPLPIEDGNPGPARYGHLNDDLTFTFQAWPLRSQVRVLGLPYAWRVKTVRFRGEDVTRSGIDFSGAGPFSGIEIEMERGAR
jgi:hypothetical protein